MCLKIDWDSHIVGSKITVFALFYFVFLNGGFFALRVWGHIFGGGCFRNFTVFSRLRRLILGPQTVIIPNTVAI